MVLGKVVGTIVTTISHKDYKNRRLLVVQPLVLEPFYGSEPALIEHFRRVAGDRRTHSPRPWKEHASIIRHRRVNFAKNPGDDIRTRGLAP